MKTKLPSVFGKKLPRPQNLDLNWADYKNSSTPPVTRYGAALEALAARHFKDVRKSVTVMSVDIMGSTALIQDLDAEVARNLLAPVLKIMINAVQECKGTIIRIAGDGVIATFGAPKTIASHALQACLAALTIKNQIQALKTGIELRIGMHSGEVTFELVGDEQHREYNILGKTVNLTLLMEKTARSGAIKLTQHTFDLLQSSAQVTYLGEMVVPEWHAPVTTYELNGVHSLAMPAVHTADIKLLPADDSADHLRKFATVMFADMQQPSKVERALRAAVLKAMLEAIYRYSGTIIHIFGEQIVATFGAPESTEDHALRAALAALAIQADVKSISAFVQLRIGLNAGEIFLERSYDPKQKQYDITGPTVNLAARMEQTAKAGTIQMTKRFLSLLPVSVQATFLGDMDVKGFKKAIQVFHLKGISEIPALFEAKNRPFYNAFIGRKEEMAVLERALQSMPGGSVVHVVSAAGLGKSRLCFEFLGSPAALTYRVLVARAYSHTKRLFLAPIATLFCQLMDVGNLSCDEATTLKKIEPFVSSSDTPYALPAILSLLGIKPNDQEWERLEPVLKNKYIFKVALEMLSMLAWQVPLILLIEDLHFLDSGTESFLNVLISHIDKLPILLLLTSRNEYQPLWPPAPPCTSLVLNAFSEQEGRAFLDKLIGEGMSLEEIKTRILSSSGGNPFYLEEMTKLLLEEGTLTGPAVPYQLNSTSIENGVKLPESIYTVLQAQIDKLHPLQRQVLEAASVIGELFSYSTLLNLLSKVAQPELCLVLSELCHKKFIYEKNLYPEREFSFMSSMISEVCYKNLLIESRKKLHAELLFVYEKLYAEPLASQIQVMAHHAYFGEQWEKAFKYCLQGAENAFETNALKVSLRIYAQALLASQHLSQTVGIAQKIAHAHVEVYHLLMRFGKFEEGENHLTLALEIAVQIKDLELQCAIYLFKAVHVFGARHVNAALELAEQAFLLEKRQIAMQPVGRTALVHAYFFTWQYDKLLDMARCVLADVPNLNYFPKPFRVSSGHLSYLFMTLGMAFKGDFLNGEEDRQKWHLSITNELSVGSSMFHLATGLFFYAKGDFKRAQHLLLKGTGITLKIELVIILNVYYAVLGCAFLRLGKEEDGRNYIEQALTLGQQTHFVYLMATSLPYIVEGLLLMQERARAQQFLIAAQSICQERGLEFLKPPLMRMQAELNSSAAGLEAALHMSKHLGLLAEEAHTYLALAKLSTPPQETALIKAHTIYRELNMPYWRTHVEDLAPHLKDT